MAARCEAAGRSNNEDNFQLTDDLAGGNWGFITDKEILLGEKGALLVVCDGMGGMNAGATASDIAVNTIKEYFSSDRLTPQVTATSESIETYIKNAIIAADSKIKECGQLNSECEGMGSTIVLAWIVGENIHVGWCGDSRAYRFNPAFGLERLTRDHSFVQELVDSGKLSEGLAFDHPDNNIITRSLGDTRSVAKPDVKSFSLCNDDVILLCSDGLCGVLRDSEIESVIAENSDSMENCRKALWTASEKAGWTDNVTVALCRIISGAITVKKPEPESLPQGNAVTETKKLKPKKLIFILVLLLIAAAFEAGHFIIKGSWWMPDIDYNLYLNKIKELFTSTPHNS